MKMYIANCSKQAQDFIYRLPEQPGTRLQRIEIGQQIQVSGDLSQKDVDAVVAQHAKYGFPRADEIDRTKPFFGVCWQVDRPVSVEKLRRAITHNDEVLEERGRELRQEAAVAIHGGVEQSVDGTGAALKSVEVSVQEEKPGTGDDHQLMSEGVRVDKNADPGKTKKK